MARDRALRPEEPVSPPRRSWGPCACAPDHVLRPPHEAHGLPFGRLRLAGVLADDDGRPAFRLALEEPVVALEEARGAARLQARQAVGTKPNLFRADANRQGPGRADRRRPRARARDEAR